MFRVHHYISQRNIQVLFFFEKKNQKSELMFVQSQTYSEIYKRITSGAKTSKNYLYN